jgi:hypothetical protein
LIPWFLIFPPVDEQYLLSTKPGTIQTSASAISTRVPSRMSDIIGVVLQAALAKVVVWLARRLP